MTDWGDPARLRGLARWADQLARPGFDIGRWEPTRRDEQGVYHMGYYVLGRDAEAFLADLGRLGWVHPVDWMAWLGTPAGARLARSPEAVTAEASAGELALLLTAIVRGERFSDGEIAGAFASGMLLAIARRAAVLAAQPRGEGS